VKINYIQISKSKQNSKQGDSYSKVDTEIQICPGGDLAIAMALEINKRLDPLPGHTYLLLNY